MKYLYYKLWLDFTGSVKDDTPALYSLIWLSVIHSVNILSLLVVANHFYKIKIFYLNNRSDTIMYASIIFVLVITVDFLLLYKNRKEIAEKYKNESKRMKVLGIILLYLYMIGSFILVYILSQVFPVK